jgi:hypothetical protein
MMDIDNVTRRKLMKLAASAGLAALGSQIALAGGDQLPACKPPSRHPPGLSGTATFDFSWGTAIEKIIETGLGFIPDVGELLSGIVEFLWPSSGTDVWSEIKAQVEQLIDQKIADNNYALVQDSLKGLNNELSDYINSLSYAKDDSTFISEKWNVAEGDFLQQLPSFQQTGYEVLLLPLFAQFANLHLTLLRDGAQFGANWGWTPDILDNTKQKLTDTINAYKIYAQGIYQKHVDDLTNATPVNYHLCEPFRAVNNFVRAMTRGVLDQISLWPYFDVTKYPQPVNIALNSEVYSDPYGTCDDSGPINLPSGPTRPISQIVIWAWALIDAAQLTYPAGGGPGGVTQTARMGDQNGGANTGPPFGGVFNVSGNPVVTVSGYAGNVLEALELVFKDGSQSGHIGQATRSPAINFTFSVQGEVLSSIHINGISNFYGNADCIVLGFQPEPNVTVDLDAVRHLYVGSSRNISLAELAGRCVTKPILVHDLKKKAKREHWDQQRQEFHEALLLRLP